MTDKNVEGQMSFFDFMREETPVVRKSRPFADTGSARWEPRRGNILYQVRLDTFRKMRVENIFPVSSGRQNMSLQEIRSNGTPGLHDVVSLDGIGKTLFWKKEDADALARANAQKVAKIAAEALAGNTLEAASFCSVSSCSGNLLVADRKIRTVALTNFGIYVQEDMCYPFLHRYPDANAAAEPYRRMLSKMAMPEKGRVCSQIPVNFTYVDVYRCTASKYAGLEYATEHGCPWIA